MPTNNQEKWSLNDRVRMWFCRISPVPYPMKREFTATEEMLIQEMESFLRQEISQAKIEMVKELVSILESSFGESFSDKERINTKIYSASLKALSNLKQNDNTTKNRVLYF
jgi:hypothetical protein